MNYLSHLLKSKGVLSLLRRPFTIYRRFGLTASRSRAAVDRIVRLTRQHGCKPSFFVTADLLDRHSDLIQRIADSGAHIGLHGHHHVDYGGLSLEAQTTEIAAGLRKFRDCKIEPTGFRGPFLRFNDKTSKAAMENKIPWVSHSVVLLNHNPVSSAFSRHSALQPLLQDFYTQCSHAQTACLPFWDDCCLEIPISLPDDEMLVDRLGIHDADRLTRIWLTMLASTHEHGEFLNLLFHPERIEYFAEPLADVFEAAVAKGDVWIASLDEIATWWSERSAFAARIDQDGPTTYRVTLDCTSRGSVVLQHPGGGIEFIEPGKDGSFVLHTGLKPAICIPAGLCEDTVRGLLNDGFVVEQGPDPSRYSLSLDTSTSGYNRDLLNTISSEAKGPLLRFWRWPGRFRSAFAFTLDLDAITFGDFFRRARYFHKAHS